MTSPIGYNNPAYSHQFDSSLYDYQYVPEIDPEYDGQPDNEQEEIHLVHPRFHDEFSGASEEFDASDESNQSIIVEECNNRRVTLICDKRNKTEQKFYEDSNFRGAYHHNISLDSEEDYRISQRSSSDPPESNACDVRNGNSQSNSVQYQRCHRYEEIKDYDDVNKNRRNVSRHRYAEITVDENGYPSIGNEIEIEHNENGYRIVHNEPQREYRPIKKPRAASPVSQTFSPAFSPSKTYQRTISPRPPDIEINPPRISTRNVALNAIEMAELSPPNGPNHAKPSQTPFFQSPKRQPPIGASSPADLQEQMKINTKSVRNGHKRHNSLSHFKETSGKKAATPSNSQKTVTQMFQAKTTPKTFSPSRRNISHSFADPPINSRSPYRSTTAELPKARTAIITPILQRKNGRNETGSDDEVRNFRKMSHTFQSTGNLYKTNGVNDYQTPKMSEKARIKRNRSVPNFAQTLSNESKYRHNDYEKVPKSVRKLDYQYSPAKSDRFSPISRSRISLIDQTKASWSNSGSDFQAPASGCLIIGAVIQIITSVASCAICFYLFSKLGRRYYLDFGIIASFVNFVLGVLGFRSQCWRWLPNRNYVSGYILLTTFSIITCAGFVYLITARPMSGDPILDLMGGGICGVSVLTILLSVTGLTMSGCCKSPPPDNRVNNI